MVKLGLYQHYKGNYYHVVGIARHSETLEPVVVYQSLYGDYGMWVRPIEIFESTITIDGKEQARFNFISDTVQTAPSLR